MTLSKRSVRNHFNRHAEEYDRYASVQRGLADWMLEGFEPRVDQVRRILEVGCGTGYLTECILALYPKAEIVAIDIAPAMLDVASARIGSDSRVLFVEHDVEQPLPDPTMTYGKEAEPGFDLIISSGTLQWLEHPVETLRLLARALRPGGRLQIGVFGAGTFRELREAFDEASRGVGSWSHGPELRTAVEWESLLIASGLKPLQVRVFQMRDTYPSVRHFLKGIQKSGANNAASSDALCRRPSVVRSMMETYSERFASAGGVFATWEWVCVSAERVSNNSHELKLAAPGRNSQ